MSDSLSEIQPPAQPGEWFCDQCGARYPEDGVCTGTPQGGQHAPAPLKPVEAAAAPAEAAPAEEATPATDTGTAGAAGTDAGTSSSAETTVTDTTAPSGATVTPTPTAADTTATVDRTLVDQALGELEQAVQSARKLLGI